MKKLFSSFFGGKQKEFVDNSFFVTVPNELIEVILWNLSEYDLCNARLVCKRWNSIIIYSSHTRIGYSWKFSSSVPELMTYISTYRNVQVLNLTFMHELSAEMFETIISKTPNLKKISFSNYEYETTDFLLKSLLKYCPQIRHLSIFKTPVTIAHLNALVYLESLAFSYYPDVNKDATELNLPNLETLMLEVPHTDMFPEVSLSRLTSLDISTFTVAHSSRSRVSVGNFLTAFHSLTSLKIDGMKLSQEDVDFLAQTAFHHLHLSLANFEINTFNLFLNLRQVRTLSLGFGSKQPDFMLDCPLLVEIKLENMHFLKRIDVLSDKLECFDILGCGSPDVKLTTTVLKKLKVRSTSLVQSQLEEIAKRNKKIRILESAKHSFSLNSLLPFLPNVKILKIADDTEGHILYTALVAHSAEHPFSIVRFNSCSALRASDVEYMAKSMKCRRLQIGGFHSWLDSTIQERISKKYKHIVFKDT